MMTFSHNRLLTESLFIILETKLFFIFFTCIIYLYYIYTSINTSTYRLNFIYIFVRQNKVFMPLTFLSVNLTFDFA